ncbi:DUF2254 domain-containing protein [Halopseudomonas maritima]|uniref:DUF2254 domain-containing protein n=1 Tax=Halopseudomonas maritima TaxID=2918528 RepID=UPI001EE9DCBA|nr:DUF2254 domain-containing protein [Halopseudomonas maritima]UJJ29983.1 DUF2254 domain-containing protein [Halopseudomonas maritima]
MISKWQWLLAQLTRTLWIRATLYVVLALAAVLLAVPLEYWLPPLPVDVGADAVDRILDILASSMLAVTTFSLSVMVAAYSAATANVTPRATRLLMQDTTTQNVLGTFIGSFLFSLVGLIALSTGVYGESGRVMLFAVTLLVIALIVVTILRWIEHLSRFGRVGDTTERVEQVTARALSERIANPCLGAHCWDGEVPLGCHPLYPTDSFYLQHLDVLTLSELAEEHQLALYVPVQPGAFVHPAQPLLWVQGLLNDDLRCALCDCFTLDSFRSFDQDPRFGCAVLSEIASRALSPAVNDPGTAIDILGRSVRLLAPWAQGPLPQQAEVSCRGVWLTPLALDDLFDDLFGPIVRDGAARIDVQLRLVKSLQALAAQHDCFVAPARRLAAEALALGEQSLLLEVDRQRLRSRVEGFVRH